MTPQEIGRQSGRIFQNTLPHYLVARSQQDQEDYGIDYEIEVMLEGDQASGVIFKVQEKGTTGLKVNAAGDQISYSDLDTNRMRYYLRELRIPAALVVIDVTNRAVYWVRLQGNAEAEAAYEAAAEANQKTLTVHLPTRNKLPDTLTEFLAEMARGQDAVMVRYLRDISSQKVLEAARALPDFDATLRAARTHADTLRLEQVERLWHAGNRAGAVAECRRVWESGSETAEARVAAGLNLIRFDGPMQSQQRTRQQESEQLQRRLAITRQMRNLAASRPSTDRLRLFAEFQDHIARMAALTDEYAGLLDEPREGIQTPQMAFREIVRGMARPRAVVEIIAEFEEAYTRLEELIRGGHIDMVAQAWAMLVADILVFVHLARNNGYGALTTGIIAWVDATLPVATKFAEDMGDGMSMVFCALQQIPLAPLGNVQEIDRRAEIARSYVRKLPAGEQQRHMNAVDQRVAALKVSPPT